MNFTLSPSSGHYGSYTDIKFIIKFDTIIKDGILTFTNEHNKENLFIIGSSNGYIEENTKLHINGVKKVEGYINLFNNDKLNENLKDLVSVNIKSNLNLNDISHSAVASFYNESQSLDAEVIPFDIVLERQEIDLSNDSALNLQIISDKTTRLEMSIKSDSGSSYTFEVLTKVGRIKISIPIEILVHELKLNNTEDKYKLFWNKFEGVGFQNTMNRKPVEIRNSNIVFKNKYILKPQKRIGPLGSNLSQDFILSDRYFVHTWKDFTSLNIHGHLINPLREYRLSHYIPEVQHMRNLEETFSLLSNKNKDNVSQTRSILHQESIIQKQKIIKLDTNNSPLYKSMSGIYSKKSAETTVNMFSVKNEDVLKFKSTPKSGGCGCSRKKN